MTKNTWLAAVAVVLTVGLVFLIMTPQDRRRCRALISGLLPDLLAKFAASMLQAVALKALNATGLLSE